MGLGTGYKRVRGPCTTQRLWVDESVYHCFNLKSLSLITVPTLLQGLLLGPVRLRILEGKATGALVIVVIPADHGSITREHDAVQA